MANLRPHGLPKSGHAASISICRSMAEECAAANTGYLSAMFCETMVCETIPGLGAAFRAMSVSAPDGHDIHATFIAWWKREAWLAQNIV
jgi:hypothetical protein